MGKKKRKTAPDVLRSCGLCREEGSTANYKVGIEYIAMFLFGQKETLPGPHNKS